MIQTPFINLSILLTPLYRFWLFALKSVISITYYLSLSSLYSVFLILSAITMYSDLANTCIHLLKFFTTSVWIFYFIYYALLSFKKSRHLMEKRVGEDFLNKFSLKGHYNSLFPLLLTLAFLLPILLEYYTFEQRMSTYDQIMKPLYEAYVTAFSESGGIIGDYANTGVIEKSVNSPATQAIYEEILKYQRPLNKITIELVRRAGF